MNMQMFDFCLELTEITHRLSNSDVIILFVKHVTRLDHNP